MHYVSYILLAGVLACAHSTDARVVLAMLNTACEEALTQADYPTAEKACQDR